MKYHSTVGVEWVTEMYIIINLNSTINNIVYDYKWLWLLLYLNNYDTFSYIHKYNLGMCTVK